MIPKSFVFISINSYNQKTTPIHSYIFPPKKSSIHSYIFQFMRIYSKKNHFPIHSYIFQFSCIYSKNKCTSNSFVYIPIHSYTFPKKTPPIHLYFSIYSIIFQKEIVVQSIRMYSNLFVYIFKKQYTVEGHTEAAKVTKNEGSRE